MASTIEIFYCYAPKDIQFLKDLETHLEPLKTSLNICTWWEDSMLAGVNRKQEINKHLEEADIVLLLVSPDFLASADCCEIQRDALKLQKENRVSDVIPVIIRPVNLTHDETISGLQVLPKNRRPISTSKNKDIAWVEVQRGIAAVIDKIRSQPQQPSDVREGFMFHGYAATNRYRWDSDLRPFPNLEGQSDLPEAPWLVSAAVGKREISRRYSLFREKNIVREFTKLPATAEAIKQFADRFGELGVSVLLHYPEKVGQPESILWSGEALQFWAKEIREMSILVTLWEMVQNKQIEKLKEHIIWDVDAMSVTFVWKFPSGVPRCRIIASEKVSPQLFFQLAWGDVLKPALYFLHDEIEKRLVGHVNPTLSLTQRKIYMVPDSLLSALYVLLLLEVQEHTVGLD
ncbi:hypothetical protein KSF_084130 [Reticulibacter mediterranei]|uniref:TIR domain-containing protein n=1 Tax=Reticulibacter mediterranei TaxID=2778369 RepID=A0A8J3N7D9_9CHLR|nr:toll/interleukin-1 receptor domain-containing protein [Reticulibacter mediterranei]GHO98365.1 hypothetical protein KSF_084130 [Reticulibacter mediterranei]